MKNSSGSTIIHAGPEGGQSGGETIFSEDIFSSGANAPQDIQDSYDSQDIQDSYDLQDLKDNQGLSGYTERFRNASLLRLPLSQYVRLLIDYLNQPAEASLSTGWPSPMFDFARFCKAHPDVTALSDEDAVREIENVMYGFADLPKEDDPWSFYFPDARGSEAARLDFMASWISVRHVPFHNVVESASRLAEEMPLKPHHERGSLYQRFISLAGWLQRLMGDKAIYLPTRRIGEVLSCDQRTVSRLRKLAISDGYLMVLKPHHYSGRGRNDATAFQFALERFPEMEDR
ncbi:MAG TPA: hypothetical protein VFE38_00055 [Edaphobacter sp.]|nr:hypothetical protein [Edaphobacter sp.]